MGETIHYSLGQPGGLKFDLYWVDDQHENQKDAPSFGALKAWVGSELIWGHIEDSQISGVEWYWDELLDSLAQAWRYLLLEETYPFGLRPVAPQLLRSLVRERWLGVDDDIINDEDNLVSGFEQAHNLARAVEGISLPMLFLLREGNLMLIATSQGVATTDFQTTISTLEALGDCIVKRIDGVNDRSAAICAAWRDRLNVSTMDLVEIASGLPQPSIRAIAGSSDFNEFWQVANDNLEPNELMAAARMVAQTLSDGDIRFLLETVRSLSRASTERLDRLSEVARAQLSGSQNNLPHMQGRHLAEWLRQLPGVVRDDDTVDPEDLLERWQIQLREVTLDSGNLDALCCWGPQHGPAILINTRGLRAHFPTGRRSSLAHEICHLLVDRRGSLPLTEALGGSVPRVPEQRANAFAAELLLPRQRAQRILSQSESLDAALRSLADLYHVSYEVASWQILNSDTFLSSQDRQTLLKHTYRYNRE